MAFSPVGNNLKKCKKMCGMQDVYDSCQNSITITNFPPQADAGGPYDRFVGEPVEFDGSGSSDYYGEVVSWS